MSISHNLRWVAAALAIYFSSACTHHVSDDGATGIAGAQAQNTAFTLHIAHINDTHSAFDPIDGQFKAQDIHVYNQWGGHPRLLSQIERHRERAAQQSKPFLVLHGGDAWQGSAYFKINEGRMNADILSRMGIDAMALGNHEFDLTNALLNDFIDKINFPLLAANIDTSHDPDLRDQTNLKPYTLFSFVEGEKQRMSRDGIAKAQANGAQIVAVFGIALDDMPNISPNVGEVIFHDMVSSAQRTVDALQAKGIRHIIALTHIGNALDIRIAEQVNGIDAIVGGHSHTLLGDFSNLGLGRSERSYAERIHNPNGDSYTCVVQAGEFAQAVGLLELHFDSQGKLNYCGGGNTLLSSRELFTSAERQQVLTNEQGQQVLTFIEEQNNLTTVDEHPELREHIDTKYKPAMQAAYGQLIAHLPQAIRHVRRPGDGGSDKHGSTLAPLVAAAQFSWANSDKVRAVSGLEPDFALLGAGGIRTSLHEGELREGDISLEMLPFASPLSIVPLRGKTVRELLTQTISATLPDGAHAGRFPYGGQIRYTFVEREAGVSGELSSLEVNQGAVDSPEWQPLDDKAWYNVVLNSYIANGNDGWLAVAEAQRVQSRRVDLALVDGELTAFPVSRVEFLDGGRLQADYAQQALDCAAESVQCNTDARSVIWYFTQRAATNQQMLTPLGYPSVTLFRQ